MAFADGVTAERSCQNCGIVTNSDICQRCTTLNACKVCRCRLPEDCFDDPNVCQVYYTVYYSIYFIVIVITNTTATAIAASGTCLHAFFCDQACTCKRQRPQSTWAGNQVVCEVDCPVDTGDTSFEAFFQHSEGEITSMIEDHRQRFGCVYTSSCIYAVSCIEYGVGIIFLHCF